MKPALINYYARLIRNGQMKEGDLPAEYHDMVMEAYAKLPPLPEDPAQPSAE